MKRCGCVRPGYRRARSRLASLNVGQSTVSECLKRADGAGLTWPLPEGVTDTDLERQLYQPQGGETRRGLAPPDWPAVHRALRRKNVTLSLVWEEYRAVHPDDGYGYSRFCELYRRWEGRLSPTMRQPSTGRRLRSNRREGPHRWRQGIRGLCRGHARRR